MSAKNTAITVIASILALVPSACSGEGSPLSPLAPTPAVMADSGVSTSPSPSTEASIRQAQAEPPGACAVIDVHRAGIEVETNGLDVTMSVPVGYVGPGAPVVYVWIPELNDGDRLGPFTPHRRGEEPLPFTFSYEPGAWDYKVSVEIDEDGDGRTDFGCSRHTGTFTLAAFDSAAAAVGCAGSTLTITPTVQVLAGSVRVTVQTSSNLPGAVHWGDGTALGFMPGSTVGKNYPRGSIAQGFVVRVETMFQGGQVCESRSFQVNVPAL